MPRLTFQAHWHPLADLMVVGRYPDESLPGQEKGDQRTVDVIHPESGAEVIRLSDPGAKGLISVSIIIVSFVNFGITRNP